MKYGNIFIAFMLCMGLSCPQMQASETPAVEEAASWGSYVPSGLTSGLSSGYEGLKAMAGYAKNTATSAAQSAHETVEQKIGYGNLVKLLTAALAIANWYGLSLSAVIALLQNISAGKIVALGTAAAGKAVALGTAAAGKAVALGTTAASVATSTPGIIALGSMASKYAAPLDIQNKYKNLALEVVNERLPGPTFDGIKKIIATEVSNRLLNERKGNLNITKADIDNRLDDVNFYYNVLETCWLREPQGSINRNNIAALITQLAEADEDFNNIVSKRKGQLALQKAQKLQTVVSQAGTSQAGAPVQQTGGYDPYASQQGKPLLFETNPYGQPQQSRPTQTMTLQEGQQQLYIYEDRQQLFGRDRAGEIYWWNKPAHQWQKAVYAEVPTLQPVYRPVR